MSEVWATIIIYTAWTTAALVIAMASGLPAFAQRSTPVTVQNGEKSPVPVVPAGRFPYQFTFDISAAPGSVEQCVQIPAPTGSTLTITSVAVEVRVPPANANVDAYVRVVRGGSLFRSRGQLNYASTLTSVSYKCIYQIDTHVGASDSGTPRFAQMCVAAPTASAAFGSTARGWISGQVDQAVIVDGNSL